MKINNIIKIKQIINGAIALVLYFINRNCEKDFWLIGYDLGRKYGGVSKDFFEYISNNNRANCYFVMEKGCYLENKEKLNKDKVLIRGSVKEYYYAFNSRVIIVAHSPSDVIPVFFRLKKIFKYKLIYNSHGIDGLKRWNELDKIYEYKYYDLVNAVGDFERNIRECELKIEKEKIKITGYSCFDTIYNNNENNNNKEDSILLMLTWREDNTKLSLAIKSIINNNKIQDILEKNNIKLYVIYHDFSGLQNSINVNKDIKNIFILDNNIDIQSELSKHSLLITDYSSVAWAFSYIEKPVIFYQFDQYEYIKERGKSYLDYNKDLFGPVIQDENDLVKYIQYYIQNNYKLEDKHRKKYIKYIKYIDNNNCERLYNEILRLFK